MKRVKLEKFRDVVGLEKVQKEAPRPAKKTIKKPVRASRSSRTSKIVSYH